MSTIINKVRQGELILVHHLTTVTYLNGRAESVLRNYLAKAEKTSKGIVATFRDGNGAIGHADLMRVRVYTIPVAQVDVEAFWAAHKTTEWPALNLARDAAQPFRRNLGPADNACAA